jgi:hypothetical protein
MDAKQILINILTIALGVGGGFLAVFYLVKAELIKLFVPKKAENTKEIQMHLLPLRLQAHERLIIFVDRINPANLLIRVHQQQIELATLHAGVINEIKAEFEHNITQQLYVNSQTWQVVRKLKDDTIAMINNAVEGLPKDTSGIVLSKTILQHMTKVNDNPYLLTIELIKKDIHQLF